MMNLLSPSAYKVLSREYWLRVLTVWGFLISGLTLTLSLFLLPNYVLIHSQLAALESEDKKSDEIVEKFKIAETSIKDANNLAVALLEPKPQVPLSTILDAVYAARSANIELKTIVLQKSGGVVNSVEARGEARSRADLIQFKSTLERSPLFKSATVPLSDLARDTNLPFAITIFLADVKQ